MFKHKMNKMILALLSYVTILPAVLAYSMPLNIPTIWDVVVVYTFGSFWMAVLAITLVYFIILALGGVHLYTNLVFCVTFLLSMALGYSNPLVAVGILLFGILYAVYATIRFMSGI